MAISMLKIRRPLGRLIFNMGIAIPGKTVFLIETAPWYLLWDKRNQVGISWAYKSLVKTENCHDANFVVTGDKLGIMTTPVFQNWFEAIAIAFLA